MAFDAEAFFADVPQIGKAAGDAPPPVGFDATAFFADVPQVGAGSFANAVTGGQVPGFASTVHPPGEVAEEPGALSRLATRTGAGVKQRFDTFMLEHLAQRDADRKRGSFGEILQDVKTSGLKDMQGKPVESYDGSEYFLAAARWLDAKYANVIGTDDEAAANAYAEAMQKNMDTIAKTPKSEGAERFQKKAMPKGEHTFGESLANFGKAFLDEPLGGLKWTLETMAESAPPLVAAAGTTLLTKSPAAGLRVMGVGSYATERYSALGEMAQEHGLDLKKEADRDKLLNDPALMKEAARVGNIRGLVIGAFDMLSGGLAGKTLSKNPLAEALAQVLSQGIAGSTGELAAEGLSGQKIKWGEVIAEFIAELPTAPFDMITAGRGTEDQPGTKPPGPDLATDAGVLPEEEEAAPPPPPGAGRPMVVDDPEFTSADGEVFPADPLHGQTVEVLESDEFSSRVRLPDGSETIFGNNLLKEPPPPAEPKEAAIAAAAPAQAAEAAAVPDSPRLTPSDRSSPIPNELIDAGKSLVEDATGKPSTFTTTQTINGKTTVVTGNVADLAAGNRAEAQALTAEIMAGVSTPEILAGSLPAAAPAATAGVPATSGPTTPAAPVEPSIATGEAPAVELSPADIRGAPVPVGQEAPMLSAAPSPGPAITPEIAAQLERRYGPVGTQARTLEEARLSRPEPYTAQTPNGDTITVRHPNYETFEAWVGDRKVGHLSVSPRGPHASSVQVEPAAQRQGVATALYTAAEQALGRMMTPSPMGMSGDAIAFWKQRFANVEPEQKQAILQEALDHGIAEKIGKSARARVDALGYVEPTDARIEGETDKVFAKRVVDKRPEPTELSENYTDYFIMTGAKVIPIGDLVSSKSDEENAQGGGNAAKRMAAAAKGELSKRAPITVQQMANGKYLIKDGNGTYTSVKALGWKAMPVLVESGEAAAPKAEAKAAEPAAQVALKEKIAAKREAAAKPKQTPAKQFLASYQSPEGVSLDVREYLDSADTVAVAMIERTTGAKGAGIAAMRDLVAKADAAGVKVRLTVEESAIDKLAPAYRELGFKTIEKRDGDLLMQRKPAATSEQPKFAVSAKNEGPGVRGEGHQTSFTGETVTPEQEQRFKNSPYPTIDALYEDAQARQDELSAIGKEIASRMDGVKLADPGLKTKEKSTNKIGIKGYKSAGQITDAIRMGFMVDQPGKAGQIIRELARHFELIDEQWSATPEGYFDRKIIIKFADGRLAEVQFWEPNLFKAKEFGIPGVVDGRKGHDLYDDRNKVVKAEGKTAPKAIELSQQMNELYAHALALASDKAWAIVLSEGRLSRPEPKYLNLLRQTSSSMMRQEWQTSEKSASTHSVSPGSSSALASKSVKTTGRISQLQNLIRATPPSGTNVVQTQPESKGKDDGETPRFQARTLREGSETAESIGLPPTKEVTTPTGKLKLKKIAYTTRRIAAALQARQRALFGTVARNDRSDEASDMLAEWMVEEVLFEMQPGREQRSGVGWYSEKFQRALDNFGVIFPELTGGKVDLPGVKRLGNQKNARNFFTALIALTSDGAKVRDNFANARRLYGEFRETGTISTAGMTGGADRITSMRTNVANVLALLAEKGPDGMHTMLMEEDTVANLRKKAKTTAANFTVKLQPHIRMPLSALIFGPKLGAFYANLMGAHGYLTMDRWWSRTFNRYRGQLLKRVSGTADRPTDKRGNKIGLAKFKQAIGQPNLSDDEALAEAYRHSKSYEDKGFKNGTALEKMANTIKKDAEGTEDTPWGPVDRTFMIDTVERARQKLEDRGTTISLADIQAILWYYEKRLYSELGARGTADISYEEVATQIAQRADQGDRPGRSDLQAAGRGENEDRFSLNLGPVSEEGQAFEFVSPNVAEGGGIAEAVDGLDSKRQRALQSASREVDDALGIKGETQDAIGAWPPDGAENTTVRATGNVDWETLKVAAAMKGHLADQKAVLIFKQQDGGTAVLYRIHVPETDIQKLHENLNEDGVEYHTLVPQKSGTDIFVVDLYGSAGDAVAKAAERYNVNVDAQFGQADFIGTEIPDNDTRTDREQRDDARRAYEEVIRQSPVQDSKEHWSRIRDNWGETLEPKPRLKVSESEQRKRKAAARAAASTKTETRTTSTGTIHFALSDAFKGKADAVFKDLRAALDKMGLGGIDLNVWQQIFADMDYGVYGVDGLYLRKVIDVSLQAKDAMSTLHHEALHALVALKLFTPTELTILKRYAEKHWITDDIKANYPKEVWVEEAIAHAFGEWSKGRKVDGVLARSFKKIQSFLKALYAVLTKHDIRTSDDIFEQIAEGKIGRRGRRSQNPVAIAALNPTPKNLEAMFLAAWHGTPHEVDKFSTSRIGTGEGRQAYGWGLYFAGKKEVAEWYRSMLSRPQVIVNGKSIRLIDEKAFAATITPPPGRTAFDVTMSARNVLTALNDYIVMEGNTPAEALDAIANNNKFLSRKGGVYAEEARTRDAVVDKLRSTPIRVESKGRLYQVNIPENEDLMDYDKYLKDQPEKIQKIVKGLINKHNLVGIRANYADGRTGKHFYDELSRNLAMKGDWTGRPLMKGDQAASEALRDAGIPGHRFLDAGSRATGRGTHNYVIYDESAIEIEGRFALQNPPHTVQQANAVTQGFLGRGQPIDRAIRTPFDLLGGLDNQNVWKPGKRLTEKMGSTGLQGAGMAGLIGGSIGGLAAGPIGAVAGFAAGATVGNFLVKANPSPTGAFRWYGPIAENAKRGLIDRYGLSEEYIEAERQADLGKGDILRQAQDILSKLSKAGMGSAESRVLKAILTGEPVNDPDMTRLAVPIRQAIDDLGAEAVSLGLISAESFERNRGAYLHRVYAKNEANQNNLVRWVSGVMQNKRKKIIGDQLKGRGIFLDMKIDRLMKDASNYPEPNKGDKWRILDRMNAAGNKASKRVYWPANKPVPMEYQGSNWVDRGPWEVRQIGKGKTTLWRDYTETERTKMGEIIDARYLIAKTFMLMANDLSTGRFYKEVAGKAEWTKDTKPAERWMEAGEYSRYWNDPDIAWVKVPDTNIQDTGGKKRWGALAGKYVRAEIWRDLNEVEIASKPRWWRTLMTQWKLNKTARNPVVHMNNIMSNLMFMDLADVRLQDLVAGIKAYATSSAAFIEARDNGAFGSDMISQEMRNNVLQPILDEITKQQVGTKNPLFAGGMMDKAKVLGIMADKIWTFAKGVDSKMLDAYQAEDEIFRMAAYMRRRSLGDSPKMAALNARDQFLNYDIRAPWVNALRNTALPFISYTYRAVPKLMESIMHRPWKVAKYAAIAYGVNALSYMLDDLDGGDDDGEERERAALRDQEQGRTWLQIPRMIRMPWRDDHGLPVFLDVRRWIPAGDIFDTTQGSSAIPIPGPLQFGGPLQLAFELAFNKKAFDGKDITNELTDTPGEQAKNVADWAWKAWAPGAFWIPNSWYWTKISDAMHGATDIYGRPYSVSQALLSSIGVKVRPLDVEDGIQWHFKDFQKMQMEMEAQFRAVARRLDRGLISQSEFDKALATTMEKFVTLEGKINAYDKRTQKKPEPVE